MRTIPVGSGLGIAAQHIRVLDAACKVAVLLHVSRLVHMQLMLVLDRSSLQQVIEAGRLGDWSKVEGAHQLKDNNLFSNLSQPCRKMDTVVPDRQSHVDPIPTTGHRQ
jgi:hypothetical protein